jgi:hypothetical protein
MWGGAAPPTPPGAVVVRRRRYGFLVLCVRGVSCDLPPGAVVVWRRRSVSLVLCVRGAWCGLLSGVVVVRRAHVVLVSRDVCAVSYGLPPGVVVVHCHANFVLAVDVRGVSCILTPGALEVRVRPQVSLVRDVGGGLCLGAVVVWCWVFRVPVPPLACGVWADSAPGVVEGGRRAVAVVLGLVGRECRFAWGVLAGCFQRTQLGRGPVGGGFRFGRIAVRHLGGPFGVAEVCDQVSGCLPAWVAPDRRSGAVVLC